MPELPEVEVTRLSFASRIAGANIVDVRMGKPLRWALGCPPESLVGQQIGGVRRRGKYLLIDLSRGMLLVHLGMSGSLRFSPEVPEPGKHDHFDLVTSLGTLRLHDPRRFGAVVFAEGERHASALRLLGRLGVEPLDENFDALDFYRFLKTKKSPIKQVLLSGDAVVGVGNIYASEALFMAGIRPTMRAMRITKNRAVLLHGAIRSVLTQAVTKGGSTLRDFSNADGDAGHFQLGAMVYGRQGLACRVCGHAIRSFRQGQRSTFYCPVCQRH
jgi:formamidopyrimidine-DNA glycosylase